MPLVTFEGTEGTGKSTLMHLVVQALQQQNAAAEIVQTREPGGCPLSEQIRQLVTSHTEGVVHPLTELALMVAARAQHIQSIIMPALSRGAWILSDRFIDATYAYQGGGRGIEEQIIASSHAQFCGDVKPDLTIWLDGPVEMCIERVRQRGDADRFDNETVAFYQRVQQGYQKRALAEPERIIRLSATQSPEQLCQQVMQIIVKRWT